MIRVVIVLTAALALLLPNVTANNTTREGLSKQMGIFNVIKFPNSLCTATTSLNGTCYTLEECNAKSGTASGACASGFGVCCTFSLGCGTTTNQNRTYHSETDFSSSTGATPCIYTICPSSSDVCKLRIDFSTFSIYTPWTSLVLSTGLPGYVPQGKVVNILDGLILGDCLVDQMTVTGSGVRSTPTMCGTGAGQHMYVDASPSCNKINFVIDNDVSYTRTWSFHVTQIECGSEYSKHDCMQYMTGLSGTFNSWNLDTTLTGMAPAATSHHLNSQYYDICFRQERGYCKICYSPAVTTAAKSSFGISASADATALQAGSGDAVCTGVTVYADYIEVENMVAPTITTSLTKGLSKHCGAIFSSVNAATASASGCTFKSPFKWGVHLNDREIIIAECKTKAYNTCENMAAGGGTIGFSMQWWQESC